MIKNYKKSLILAVLTVLIFAAGRVEAKWWFFGQGNDEVNVNYLYINKNSYDESGSKLTLYKQNLVDGNIEITGKASVRSGKIGAVYVSKDSTQTWEKATLNNNGVFKYAFTPETDNKYEIYIKIIDTTGKTNVVDDTHKQIVVVDKDVTTAIRETLDAIIKSYENEEPNLFMTYVSPNFAGDEVILSSAIRKDFNAFDLIKINFFINNVSTSPEGKTYVSISYQRTVVATKTGNTYSDNGNTEIVFNNENGKEKIFSMKTPLMFGLSDAGNVATGTIQSTNNAPIILVDSSGNVDEKPFREAVNIIENNSDIAANTESGTGTLIHFGDGFTFASESLEAPGDFLFEHSAIMCLSGGNIQKLTGVTSLSSVSEVPSTGYNVNTINPAEVGSVYALLLSSGKYAIIKVTSFTAATNLTFEYKYQPDGSRNF